MVDFSVVVLCYNSQAHIEQCVSRVVDSLRTLNSTFELLVVDNGSSDNSAKLLEQLAADPTNRLQLTRLGQNLGTTVSRNLALKAASGRSIIFLDADAYANAEAIAALSRELASDKNLGLVVPRLVFPDGRPQMSTDTFPTLQRKVRRLCQLRQLEAVEPTNRGRRVDYAISAFWMMPRSTLEAVGFLDERIFYSPEDVDYCIRIWNSGLSIHLVPSVSVVHDAQELSRRRGYLFNPFAWRHLKGLFYLFYKHRYMFRRPGKLEKYHNRQY